MARRELVAIPAWNESGSIADVVTKVRQHRPQADILVVDDGSTDDTALLADQAGAVVVSLPFNVGVGGAMRTAFLYAKRHGYQAMVQVDADGQHDPVDLDLDGLELLLRPSEHIVAKLIDWKVILILYGVGTTVVTLVEGLLES